MLRVEPHAAANEPADVAPALARRAAAVMDDVDARHVETLAVQVNLDALPVLSQLLERGPVSKQQRNSLWLLLSPAAATAPTTAGTTTRGRKPVRSANHGVGPT